MNKLVMCIGFSLSISNLNCAFANFLDTLKESDVAIIDERKGDNLDLNELDRHQLAKIYGKDFEQEQQKVKVEQGSRKQVNTEEIAQTQVQKKVVSSKVELDYNKFNQPTYFMFEDPSKPPIPQSQIEVDASFEKTAQNKITELRNTVLADSSQGKVTKTKSSKNNTTSKQVAKTNTVAKTNSVKNRATALKSLENIDFNFNLKKRIPVTNSSQVLTSDDFSKWVKR